MQCFFSFGEIGLCPLLILLQSFIILTKEVELVEGKQLYRKQSIQFWDTFVVIELPFAFLLSGSLCLGI